MKSITICLVHFKSLSLINLSAALYSVRVQDLSNVESLIIVNNDTADSVEDIQAILDDLAFPIPVNLKHCMHGDATKTHSWSTNAAVRLAVTHWVLFTRSDYLLDFDLVRKFWDLVVDKEFDGRCLWNGFVTGNVYHLGIDVGMCETTLWREVGPRALRSFAGAEADYTPIDAGVWMARRQTFEGVGGLDESLTAWGHAQTHFQYKLHKAGVEFVRIPEVLFYHPQHSASRDIVVAHQQLEDRGIDLKELWNRYEGASPYP